MRRFLAINEIPQRSDAEVRHAMERLTEAAHHVGVRPLETFYSLERGRAYTYVEGGEEDDIRKAYSQAHLPLIELVHAERLHTELLDLPRRAN